MVGREGSAMLFNKLSDDDAAARLNETLVHIATRVLGYKQRRLWRRDARLLDDLLCFLLFLSLSISL